MPNTSEEMRLRDTNIGLQAELNESVYQREKVALINSELRLEQIRLQDIIAMRDAELRLEQQKLRDVVSMRDAELRLEQQKLRDVVSMRDVEITAIRQSHTWKIGSLVLAPVRWIRRSKR